MKQLTEMQNDGLLILDNRKISITETGRRFVRNVCMAIDPLLKEKKEKDVFSATV
jgi:oxygen-independent coproporphyrinogen-3 oxidase